MKIRDLVLWTGMSLGLGMLSYKSSADSPEALAKMDPVVPVTVEKLNDLEEIEEGTIRYPSLEPQLIEVRQDSVSGLEQIINSNNERPKSSEPRLMVGELRPVSQELPLEPEIGGVDDSYVPELEIELGGKKERRQHRIELRREKKQGRDVSRSSNPAVSYHTPEELGIVPIPFSEDNFSQSFKQGSASASFSASLNLRTGLRGQDLSLVDGKTSLKYDTATKYDVVSDVSMSESLLLTGLDEMAKQEAELEKKKIAAMNPYDRILYQQQQKEPTIAELRDNLVDNNFGLGEVQSRTTNYGFGHGEANFGLRQTEVRNAEGNMEKRQFFNAAYQGFSFAEDEKLTTILAGLDDEHKLSFQRGVIGQTAQKTDIHGSAIQLNLNGMEALVRREQGIQDVYKLSSGEPGTGWSAFHRLTLNSKQTTLNVRGYQLGHIVDPAGERYLLDLGPKKSGLGFGEEYLFLHYGATEGLDFLFEENDLIGTSRFGFSLDDTVSFARTKSGVNSDLKVTSPELMGATYIVKTVGSVTTKSLAFPEQGVTFFENPVAQGVEYSHDGDYLKVEEVVSLDNPEGQVVVTAQHHKLPVRVEVGDETRFFYSKDGLAFTYDGKFSSIIGTRDLSNVLGFNSEGHLVVGMNHTPQVGQTGLVQASFGPFTGEMHLSMSEGFSDAQILKWYATVEEGYFSLGAIQALNQEPGFTGNIDIPLGPSGGLSARLLYQLDNPLAGGEHTIEATLVGKYSR